MSDPVTNVEIEDVLSSIRRLVSDGDKARTRDPAPIEVDLAATGNVAEQPAPAPESPPAETKPAAAKPDRLVLTPAFLVVDSEPEVKEDLARPAEDDAKVTPLHLAGMVSSMIKDTVKSEVNDTVEDAIADVFEDDIAEEEGGGAVVLETPDRSSLVATIAELEAAISAGDDEYELDGSEVMPETMAWPSSVMRGSDTVEDAEVSEDDVSEGDPSEMDSVETDVSENDELAEDDEFGAFEHRIADPAPEIEASDTADEYGDDDLDGLLEAGSVDLDEDALRALVGEIVREELTGPMGERITRNVRKLVRREIYRILSSQEFD